MQSGCRAGRSGDLVGRGGWRGAAAAAMAAFSMGVATAGAQVEAAFQAPTLDRWMYPFGDASGLRPTAPNFSSIGGGFDQFDDRDATLVLAWDTAALIPAGGAPAGYAVQAVRVSVRTVVDDGAVAFVFDPTSDPFATYVPGDATVDADAGRPVEIFAAGYRGGFVNAPASDPAAFRENSPFGPPAQARGTRYVHPVDFVPRAGDLVARDVSNNVLARFEARSLAVGEAMGVAPGQPVPSGSEMRFDLDLTAPGALAYLQRSLAEGRLTLVVSSLHPTIAFGAGEVNYPVFATRQNPFFAAPRLVITLGSPGAACNVADIVSIGGFPPADGELTVDDYTSFINAFAGDELLADIVSIGGFPPADGELTVDDYTSFINAFAEGCGE